MGLYVRLIGDFILFLWYNLVVGFELLILIENKEFLLWYVNRSDFMDVVSIVLYIDVFWNICFLK